MPAVKEVGWLRNTAVTNWTYSILKWNSVPMSRNKLFASEMGFLPFKSGSDGRQAQKREPSSRMSAFISSVFQNRLLRMTDVHICQLHVTMWSVSDLFKAFRKSLAPTLHRSFPHIARLTCGEFQLASFSLRPNIWWYNAVIHLEGQSSVVATGHEVCFVILVQTYFIKRVQLNLGSLYGFSDLINI